MCARLNEGGKKGGGWIAHTVQISRCYLVFQRRAAFIVQSNRFFVAFGNVEIFIFRTTDKEAIKIKIFIIYLEM